MNALSGITRRLRAPLALFLSLVVMGTVLVSVASPAHAAQSTGFGGVYTSAPTTLFESKRGLGISAGLVPAKTWQTVSVAAGQAQIPGAVSLTGIVESATSDGQLRARSDVNSPSVLILSYTSKAGDVTSNSSNIAVSSNGTIQIQIDTPANVTLARQGVYSPNVNGLAPGGFSPINGERLVDTRSGLRTTKGVLTAGKTITVKASGSAGVPLGASGVVVNFTTLNATKAGMLKPYAAGDDRNNNAFYYPASATATTMSAHIPLSTDGSFAVWNGSGTTDLVIDVQGYFADAEEDGASFTPGAGNIFDSRQTSSSILASNETRALQVAGSQGVPAMDSGISAIVVTLTAVRGTSSTGSATLWADGDPRPADPSIASGSNSTRSNTVTVPLGPTGKINLGNTGDPSHYLIEIQGWYTDALEPRIGCINYASGSVTPIIPTTPISCSVRVSAAAIAGRTLTIQVGTSIQTVALPATTATNISVSIPAVGDQHEILAHTMTAAGEIISERSYSFRVGGAWDKENLVPTPADVSTVPRNVTLTVAPERDTFTDDVSLRYSVFGPGAGGPLLFQSDWVIGGIQLPSDLMAPGSTYSWSTEIRGTPLGASSQLTRTSPTWTMTAEQSVVVSVAGDLGTAPDTAVKASDAATVGVTQQALQAVQVATVGDSLVYDPSLPATAASSTPADVPAEGTMRASTGGYDVMGTWRSKDNQTVYLRRQALDKIRSKHNLDAGVVRRVTQSYNYRVGAGTPTKFSYFLGVADMQCYVWGCKVKQSTTVQAVVDYRRIGTSGQTYGVVTTYCQGFTWCPSYVKNALNK